MAYFQCNQFFPERKEWSHYIQLFEIGLKIHGLGTREGAEQRKHISLSKAEPQHFKILVG